ncbi:MAG: transcription antitermination factor NusB, partial [Corallococcus sp.]|nr:transcription antitermination factor NusB [Corallococcus sp.]
MRSYAREVAFSKVYQFLMSNDVEYSFDQYDTEKLNEEDIEFVSKLVGLTTDNSEALQHTVGEFSRGYKCERIYKVDLAIIEMAIAEMSYTETPAPIVINEAVSLAKKYSTEKSVA